MRMRHLLPTLLFLALVTAVWAQDARNEIPTVTAHDCPAYPEKAKTMRLQGMVVLVVTTDGQAVADVKLRSGHPVLAPAAIDNVRTWKFASHPPTAFEVRYLYVHDPHYKQTSKGACVAKFDLPRVTVPTKLPGL